ncbi:D-beta-hydroxybutyrate dehydrogenase, mitochondrial-like [Ornithodoros turicata]|uniref:D-beta-hydroxybutyrate dehydrogenase, mitochondrial-like n=1 Tax=Ornithodoros turicata TaxID=34597 RepID=UPI003138D25C
MESMWPAALLLAPLVAYFIAVTVQRRRRFDQLSGTSRRLLISGCDSGIGLELALQLHGVGFTVLAGCLSEDSEGALKLKSISSPRLCVVSLDVTDDASIDAALEKVGACEHGLWGLVNNAGVCIMGEYEWLTIEQIERQIQVNLMGALRLTRACLPFIRNAKGRIVSLSSVQATQPFPGLSVYSASKTALESFSEGLSVEVARHGVHVAVVQPGDVVKHTSLMERQRNEYEVMWNAMSESQKELYGKQFKKYQKTVLKNMGYFSPIHLRNARVFRDVKHALCSDQPRTRYDATDAWAIFLRILALSPAIVSRSVLVMVHHMSLKS